MTLWIVSGRWDVWAEWNASWAELSTPTALMFMVCTAGRWTSAAWGPLFLIGTALLAVLTSLRVWTGVVLVPFLTPSPPSDLF